MTQPDTRPVQTRPPGTPPINGHAPAPPPVRDEPDSPGGRRDASTMPGSRAERLIAWIVPALLAGADAFGFFRTLTKLIQRNSPLVAFFVGALAPASVAAAHPVGAGVRSLREGYGGSVRWVGVVSTLWLSLGGLIAWVHATETGTTSVSSAVVGDLSTRRARAVVRVLAWLGAAGNRLTSLGVATDFVGSVPATDALGRLIETIAVQNRLVIIRPAGQQC